MQSLNKSHKNGKAFPIIIKLHIVEYKQRPKRVQISRGICIPEDRLDRFSRNAQATYSIEVTEKMADNLNYFSDDEESEWLAKIDLSFLR